VDEATVLAEAESHRRVGIDAFGQQRRQIHLRAQKRHGLHVALAFHPRRVAVEPRGDVGGIECRARRLRQILSGRMPTPGARDGVRPHRALSGKQKDAGPAVCRIVIGVAGHRDSHSQVALEDGIMTGMAWCMPTRDTVVVVHIRLDDHPGNDTDVLDDVERAQAARFVFERDRRRYIAAHTAVRVVLGRCLDVAPDAVTFACGARGKPRLAGCAVDLRFNLSHSGERALLAVALGREVGVDIEHTTADRDFTGVASASFSPSEIAALDRAPATERREAFFRIWTRKESFIKALGDGMHFPLDGFDVSAEPSSDQLLLACHAAPEEMARWKMRPVVCEAGYTAAVTVEGGAFEISSIHYSDVAPG
jgi:4'-phosphopantetheinyl transferase